MNELCRFYQPHLPLYAEGELKDPYLAERIQSHVWCCSECQDWLEDYEDLTYAILGSTVSSKTSLTIAGAAEGDLDEDFDDDVTRARTDRVDRILSSVKARAALRPRCRCPSPY